MLFVSRCSTAESLRALLPFTAGGRRASGRLPLAVKRVSGVDHPGRDFPKGTSAVVAHCAASTTQVRCSSRITRTSLRPASHVTAPSSSPIVSFALLATQFGRSHKSSLVTANQRLMMTSNRRSGAALRIHEGTRFPSRSNQDSGSESKPPAETRSSVSRCIGNLPRIAGWNTI